MAFATLLCAATTAGQAGRFQGQVEVRRVVVDARVVDRRGEPLAGLAASDFRVLVDGRGVPVEAVEWVPGDRPYAEGLPPRLAAAAGTPAAPPGRLIVLLFQSDFGLEASRTVGLFRMAPKALELVDSLQPGDRVAVLSFGSHLSLHLDFTADRALLRSALSVPAILAGAPSGRPQQPPSLAASFDRDAARRAAELESGLLVIGHALAPLPGAKTLVLFGWGLGHRSPPFVVMGRDYDAARRALLEARVTVFSLDITDADYHTLQAGLEQVAEDTGGFYAKTSLFPDIAMTRLEGALAGHYVLVFEMPPGPRGRHALAVSVAGGRGTVLAKTMLED